jgi:hypothetical protein
MQVENNRTCLPATFNRRHQQATPSNALQAVAGTHESLSHLQSFRIRLTFSSLNCPFQDIQLFARKPKRNIADFDFLQQQCVSTANREGGSLGSALFLSHRDIGATVA